ncbi:MAG: biotin/lipoyl-containing protein [Candidatus Omnitrophota bacterium]
MRDILLPDFGPDIEEATISFWHVEEGEHVEAGTNIVEVTTDKSTVNVPSPCAGVITELIAVEGETVTVGNIIARIEEED